MQLEARRFFLVLGGASLALLTACGGGGGTPDVGEDPDPTELTGAVGDVPVAGQLLADCSEAGLARIEEFVAASPLPEPPAEVPNLEDVLVSGDPSAIPVIGGFVPAGELPSDGLAPVSAEDALAMLPEGGLPADLPVGGAAPVSCSDVPLPSDELPAPTDALGLIPVFDESGDPTAVVLATVSTLQENAPAPGDDVGLPDGADTLPEPLATAVGTLLGLVPVL